MDWLKLTSESEYRTLFESNPQPMWVFDLATLSFLAVNDAAIEQFGYSREEFLQMTVKDISPPDEIPRLMERLLHYSSPPEHAGVFKHRAKDGRPIEFEITAQAITFHGKRAMLVIGSGVTDRQTTMQAFQDQKILLETILRQAAAAIVVCDSEGKLTFVNAAARRLALLDPHETRLDLGPEVWGTAYTLDGNAIPVEEWSLSRALRGETTTGREIRMVRPDGSFYDILISATPLKKPDGGLLGAVAIFSVITARKRAEEDLKENREMLAVLLGNLPGFVYRCKNDRNWTLQYVSEGTTQLLGYTPEHLLVNRSVHPGDLIDPEDQNRVWREVQEALGRKEPFEVVYRIISGSNERKWVCDRGHGIYAPNGELLYLEGYMTDVTRQRKTEEALKESEGRLATLLSNLPGYAYRCMDDPGWTLNFISEGVFEITGYRAEEYLVDKTITCGEKIHPEDRQYVWETVQAAIEQRRPFDLTYRIYTKSNQLEWVSESGRGIYSPTGELCYIDGFVTCITKVKQTEDALRKNEAKGKALINALPDQILILDRDGTVLDYKPEKAMAIYERPSDRVGKNIREIMPPEVAQQIMAHLIQALESQDTEIIEYQRAMNEALRDYEVQIAPCGRDEGVAFIRDVTERKAQAAVLEYHALHDPLTNLPNRLLLREHLQEALLLGQRNNTPVAVMLMDLDRFKEVNDTLGHDRGDRLLQQAGSRLRSAVWEPDVVARLGGDEFAVLLPRLASADHTTVVVNKILRAFAKPFILDDLTVDIAASIGIALFPSHGEDADTLMRRADIAMYQAKQTGHPHMLYSPEQDHYSPHRLGLMAGLRQAIEQNELMLHYQPKINLKTREIIGVEALVRWQHPKQGLIPPDQFIPLAERTGLIKPLTLWVIDTALAQSQAWHHAGLEIGVAVNLSARTLQDPQLAQQVHELLQAHERAPGELELEITESVIMADPARAMEILRNLRNLGIHLSIDDFGTGYSSLANLKKLPVDTIKIDKSFVIDMLMDNDNATIVRSTIDLARNLGLLVIAEGVEDEATWNRLDSLGCDAVQGYYVTRPLPAPDLTAWLRQCPWKLGKTNGSTPPPTAH